MIAVTCGPSKMAIVECPIRVVSLDVFGTLLDLEEDRDRPGAYETLSRWLGYRGVRGEAQEIRRRIGESISEHLAKNSDPYPDVDMIEVLGEVLRALEHDAETLTDTLVFETATLLRALTTVSLTLVPGAEEALERLATRFRLAICSNTQRAYTVGELRSFRLLDRFEQILFSSDVKACKPSARMFRELLNRVGEPPERVVHVGDSLVDDIAGAAALGLRTIWLKRHDTSLVPTGTGATGASPDRTVERRDLRSILDSILTLDENGGFG